MKKKEKCNPNVFFVVFIENVRKNLAEELHSIRRALRMLFPLTTVENLMRLFFIRAVYTLILE